ncbi:MAG TPA: Rrf2 family transcriptional regulator [Marinilabiliaceae bacterium]|jgi:Rrf2 family iron-sulfur cluster assembly transcriptional regulator|nr:Rrf2 family transcriptional regulator [Marinilabiliaceae bacterium]
MLSNTCKYALRSIIYIGINSKSGSYVNVRTIAGNLDVPMQFLSKILQIFVHKGILGSIKGPQGGFIFKKDPYQVTLFDVIGIIDGPNMFEHCIIGTRPCISHDKDQKKCPVHDHYSDLRKELEYFFKNETFGKIIDTYENRTPDFLSL